MCHSCHDRQASTIIRNLTRGIIANHTNLLSIYNAMHCIATTPIRGYLDNYHSANLDQAYYYSPCCACNDLPPSRPSWKVQNSNLICRHSLRKLVPEVRERWLFMICIWDAFWLLFLHFHTVATGHGILNSSIPPDCLNVEATYIFFWIVFIIQVFSQKSRRALCKFCESGALIDFLRLRDWLVCIWETLRLVCKTYS